MDEILEKFKPYPTSLGKIEELAIAFAIKANDEKDDLELYINFYSELISKLTTVKFWHVIVAEKYECYVHDLMKQKSERSKYKTYRLEGEFSNWIQDAFVVAENSSKELVLIQSRTDVEQPNGAGKNIQFAATLAAETDFKVHTCKKLIFTGSNILSNDEKILFAYDSCLHSTQEKWHERSRTRGGKKEEPLENIQTIFNTIFSDGKEPVWLSSDLSCQSFNRGVLKPKAKKRWIPMEHLDLFITVLDGNKIALADVYLLADESMAQSMIDRKNKDIELKAIEVDKIIEVLEHYKFDVVRNPVPYINGVGYAYYNNCLVECYTENKKEIKKIYLPQYANSIEEGSFKAKMQEADKNAMDFFSSPKLKFEVMPINLNMSLSKHKGALHCLTKALKKSNYD